MANLIKLPAMDDRQLQQEYERAEGEHLRAVTNELVRRSRAEAEEARSKTKEARDALAKERANSEMFRAAVNRLALQHG
jgi:hypothetical protein